MNGPHRSAGPTRQWLRDRGKLVLGETWRRRGLGGIQGHGCVPLLKTDLTRYKSLTLLSYRVLVGAAGDTSVCSADADAVEVHAEHQCVNGTLLGQEWEEMVDQGSLAMSPVGKAKLRARWKTLGAWQCRLTCAQLWQRRWRQGRGCSGGAFYGLAQPEMWQRARARSPLLGGARCRRKRARERRQGGKWASLPLGEASWQPGVRAGADRQGRHRSTAATGNFTRRPVVFWQTESSHSVADESDWNSIFTDILLPICSMILPTSCCNTWF